MNAPSLRPPFWGKWGWILVLLVSGGRPALADFISPDPTLTVTEGGQTIGTITMNVSADGRTISGDFTATQIDPNTGRPYTLDALGAQLNEHFNWFQVLSSNPAINVTTYTYNAAGTAVTGSTTNSLSSFIDPQSNNQQLNGATNVLWADTLPWYWDETIPPIDPANITGLPAGVSFSGHFYDPNQTELQAHTNGSTLTYADTPGGGAIANTTLTFTTFLMSISSDFPNTYIPLAGFGWTDVIDANGKGTITLNTVTTDPNLLTPLEFPIADATLINNSGFGQWTIGPEPSSVVLLSTGILGIFCMRRREFVCFLFGARSRRSGGRT